MNEGERQPIVTAGQTTSGVNPPSLRDAASPGTTGAQAVEGPLAELHPSDSGSVCHEHAAGTWRCTDCGAPAVEMVLQAPRCALHANEVARRVDFDAMREGK